MVKYRGAPRICNEVPGEKNIILKMSHNMSLNEEVENLDFNRE
jgi:hypothetical protein